MNFLKSILASIIGFIVGLGLVVLLFFIIIAGIVSNINKKPEVKGNTVLELRIAGAVPERLAENPFANFGQGQAQDLNPTVGLDKIISGLEYAAKDKHIKGVILRPDLYAGGLATAEEIRSQILKFRKSGKFVYAYAEVLTDGGYFIATACDKIYLNPKGFLEFNGFSGKVAFYKGMLDKIGVKFEVFKAGKYKGAVEPFIQTSLSEPNRQQIRDYVNQLFGYHIKSISEARKIDSAELADIANKFLARTAAKALQYKLVDGLKYEDEVEAEIRSKIGLKKEDKYKPMAFASYVKSDLDEKYHSDKIAVIYATGDINMGKNESGDGIGSETLAANIRKARLDEKIKAVVLRVNSPGGSSNASDIIAREIEMCKKVKPVIISFGDVAASGGYYISCVGDSIFAYHNSVTGSIGVFALVPNTSGLYKDKLGLSFETVPTGEFAAGWRPDEALSEGMRQYFQEMVNEVYGDFIGIVAKGRKLDTSVVAGLAEGHVYTAIAAKKLGLIDNYGGIQRAIQSAAWKAKLKEYRVVSLPDLKSPWEMFFGNPDDEDMSSKILASQLGEFYAPIKELKRIQSKSGLQMIMPWEVKID
ncbi:MAG: signal peptide peptidase SppA [Bacteroidetes bacterium]|nr:signal peptide peptidase SppA [Bacteroidota bacterium]